MITSKCLKGYSELIPRLLDTYSDDITLRVLNLINTDEEYLKIKKVLDKHPTEQELIAALETIEQEHPEYMEESEEYQGIHI